MQRAVSDSSIGSGSGSRLRRFGSAISRRISANSKVPITTSGTPTVQKFVQELEATDPWISRDERPRSGQLAFEQLRATLREIYEASSTPEGIEATISIYLLRREQALANCQSIVDNAAKSKVEPLLTITPDTDALEFEPENAESMEDVWLTIIHDFKAYQQLLLEHVRSSIASKYEICEPHATILQVEALFDDIAFRTGAIPRMQFALLPRNGLQHTKIWQCESHFHTYDLLKQDLTRSESVCATARSKKQDVSIREYEIAVNGDSILEFACTTSEFHPLLRFRVSSHMLTEASPYFARIFKSSYLGSEPESPLEYLERFPPPPMKHVCRDGTEVKLFRMPQFEYNKSESLTTMLEAAHMHNDKLPREVRFDEFISIAEVCLRYQCTGPLEMSVEYRWLPAWIHKANEEFPEGFLLIAYVFGLRRLFNRTSKSIILNSSSDEDIQNNLLWPNEVKDRILAIREAKLSQIYAACLNVVQEYIQKPSSRADGSIATLTSVAKCPRGFHRCDATNLGWLMLIFNELGVLHTIMNANNGQRQESSARLSINELVTQLRRMPSAPQMHTGVCDYAPAFRNALDDIYNSVTGLTFLEVSGKEGWALSKRHDKNYAAGDHQDIFELPASTERPTLQKSSFPNDRVILKILGYADSLEDLHSAAIVNKEWYAVFKANELSLLRNLARATKRKTFEMNLKSNIHRKNGQSNSLNNATDASLQRTATAEYVLRSPLREDANSFTPPRSPRSPHTPSQSISEVPLTPSEVEEILWGNTKKSVDAGAQIQLKGATHSLDPESNAKFLSSDIVQVDKSLVIEDKKHLREECDKKLRMGPQTWV